MNKKLVIGILVVVTALLMIAGSMVIFWNMAQQVMNPIEQANSELRTQVAKVLNPTPTILPDPVTIIKQVRSLARLETIQYSVEKVITAETGQESLGILFGDRLLLVAHGTVIAGVDLTGLADSDFEMQNGQITLRLPSPEIFVATLDNETSYVYDRQTGLLTKGDAQLETLARQSAEQEIRKAALEDGILSQAAVNAEAFLVRFLDKLGFSDVILVFQDPEND
jgi:uncharacterized membrane protein (Fun14 family)